MRPLELALTVANAFTVAGLFIGAPETHKWQAGTAVLAALLALAQILLEGSRWQMTPAYVLTGALLVVLVPAAGLSYPVPPGVVRGIGIAASVLVLLLAIALPFALPVFRFPAPTGPYAIGTATCHWTDASRPELFTTDPHENRQVMAQLWYPAQNQPGRHAAPYLQDAPATTRALARLMHVPPFAFSHFRYVTTHAIEDAPVAQSENPYPVLIYLTGLGGFRDVSMYQIQELASHGYVVIGLDQPGAASTVRFPDGREIRMPPIPRIQALIDQSLDPADNAPSLDGRPLPDGILPYLANDVSFTIDQLTSLNAATGWPLAGHLGLTHIGVFGFSLGAMVAAEAAHQDPRINAVLMMDAAMPANVVQAGLSQPSMWMTRPASSMRLERSRSGGWTERDIAQTLTTMREVFQRHSTGNAYYLQMPGMFHVNYTDAPYYSPFTRQLGLTGPVDSRRMYAVVNSYTLAFFNTYLKGHDEPLLAGPDPDYPEVEFERR